MKVITGPASEPVTTTQAKAAARIAGTTEFDALLPLYIQAAREIAEMECSKRFMEQTIRAEYEEFPSAPVPVPGPTDVSVSYWSAGLTWVTMANPTDFSWWDAQPGAAIAPPYGTPWPVLGVIAGGPRVRVDVTAGATDAADVPAAVKTFIMAMVAYWIDNPQAYTDRPHTAAPHLLSLLDTARESVY